MEKEILGYKSPLYGRRTAQFKIEPFDYYDASLFFPQYSSEEKFNAYAVLGGIAQYLKQFDQDRTIEDNTIKNIISKNSFLYEEPYFLLKQELKEPALYFSIIEAIANGASKYNEISTKIGTDCGFYLNTLIELHIVKKQLPLGEKSTSRKSVYTLNDNLFLFWFRFLSNAALLIEQELLDTVYNEIILPGFPQYAGHIFENVCMQYLKRINGRGVLPFTFFEIGKWWGNNQAKQRQEEIDIVAVDNKSNALFGECKWRNEPLDITIIRDLIEKSRLLPYENNYYILFSKSGFTTGATQYAHENGMICKTVNDLYNIFTK